MFEFLFGKPNPKKSNRPKLTPQLLKLHFICKKNRVPLRKIVNGKMVYKTVATLKKECNKKMKSKKSNTTSRKPTRKPTRKPSRKPSKKLLAEFNEAIAGPLPDDDYMPDRKNIIKNKIRSVGKMSKMLKDSRSQLSRRFPGDTDPYQGMNELDFGINPYMMRRSRRFG
jgi:hypothetical protein